MFGLISIKEKTIDVDDCMKYIENRSQNILYQAKSKV